MTNEDGTPDTNAVPDGDDTPESSGTPADGGAVESANGPAAVEPTGASVHQPSRKDRLRPTELLVLSGIMGLFTGVIVLMATRQLVLATVSLGIAFIAAVVGLAMFSLTFKPNSQEVIDLEEQDRDE